MSVITNSLAMMDTSSAVTSLDADAVVYDNTTSGLTATDAQAAIDELDNTIDTISTEIGSLDAADVGYTKTISGEYPISPVAITNVQEAFDYLLSVDTAQPVSSNIVNYHDSSGFLFYNTYSVQRALEKVDYVLASFLEYTDSGQYTLPANNIAIPAASKTGIYANADDVQDALDAIKTALDSGGGSGGSVDAEDVTFSACGFYASCDNVADAFATVESALNDLAGSYSTSEVELSATWIDDSHIYQKTFYFDPSVTLTATQWTALSDTTISGLADIIDVKGIFAIVDGNTETPCNVQYIMTKYDSGLSVYLIGATAVPSSTSLILKAITVQYTKT